jgi:hypothetical protein
MAGDHTRVTEDRDAVRRASRRLVLFVVGLATVGIVMGLVAGFVGGHATGTRHDTRLWSSSSGSWRWR